MSVDSSMDLEEELFPLVGRDALQEYSRWTSLVKFITDGDERLDMSSDSSCFSPFRWENLLKEVGEQWCSPDGQIECHHGDVARRHCHGGTKVRAPEPSVRVGAHRGVGAPECQIGVGARLGRIFMDADRQLVKVIYKDPIGGRFPSGRQFCEEVDGIIVLSRDMMQFDPSKPILELAHLLAVCHHKRALVGGLLHDLVDDQL